MLLTIKKVIIILQLFVVMMISPLVLMHSEPAGAAACDPNKNILGVPTWYKYLEGETDSTGRCSPTINSSADALPIGLAVLEGMLRIAGLIAVAMVFVGSYKYIISVGNPEKTTGARKTIQNSLIGLVIVIISTGLITFIGGRLSSGPDVVGSTDPTQLTQHLGVVKI